MLTQSRERKAEVGAAFVAEGDVDADEGAAGGTEFGARLSFAAAEETAQRSFPAIDAPLPTIGKRQDSSLRAVESVPIIPKSRRRSYSEAGKRTGGAEMDKFEEIGRRLDEELTRLRKYVDEEIAPEAERKTAIFLREVSEKLTD